MGPMRFDRKFDVNRSPSHTDRSELVEAGHKARCPEVDASFDDASVSS